MVVAGEVVSGQESTALAGNPDFGSQNPHGGMAVAPAPGGSDASGLCSTCTHVHTLPHTHN